MKLADVQLDAGDVVELINHLSHVTVLLDGGAADIDKYLGINILDARIDLAAESLDTHILQSHGIEHARMGLGHAGIGVALTTLAYSAFDDDTAQTGEVDKVGELLAIAEGAGGGHHGILQRDIVNFSR